MKNNTFITQAVLEMDRNAVPVHDKKIFSVPVRKKKPSPQFYGMYLFQKKAFRFRKFSISSTAHKTRTPPYFIDAKRVEN